MADDPTKPAKRDSLLARAATAARLAQGATDERVSYQLRSPAAELTLQASSMEGSDMAGTDTLHRVVYCSRNVIAEADVAGAAGDSVARGIEAILAASRRNNRQDGITGALVFSEGCFAQALEGPVAAVEHCFARIQRDFRHADVTVLESRLVVSRLFGDWSMAYGGVLGPQAAARLGLDRVPTAPRSLVAEAILTVLHDVVRSRTEDVLA